MKSKIKELEQMRERLKAEMYVVIGKISQLEELLQIEEQKEVK